MLESVFKLPLHRLEGRINSLFTFMDVALQPPDYTSISKRAKQVSILYCLPSMGPVAHLVIAATGLKVYGEGEWKARKHGKESGESGASFTWRSMCRPTLSLPPKSALKRWG